MTIEENDLLSMSLHEDRWLQDQKIGVLKVIGGWIYYEWNDQTDQRTSMVFVPLPKKEIEITGKTKLDF